MSEALRIPMWCCAIWKIVWIPDSCKEIEKRLEQIRTDALAMNQESLAECLYPHKWYNPFPKFKYTERPDTATAEILDGKIVLLTDNSPAVMILPVSVFDIMEEADDFYFPPVTGTYLRVTRFVIALLTLLLTPTWSSFFYRIRSGYHRSLRLLK